MALAATIRYKTYRIAGTDCRIWLGDYANKSEGNPRRFCYLISPISKRKVDAREWLYGDPRESGFNWCMPVCGNGRCLAPEHQATSKIPEVPTSE
ncbi:hypothetical protein [Micromonospora palomenae]|uniref:hypothetical protein n=1 Tax=Micromonospora palomenae TaxID=1461247 RepID=UPI003F89DD4D